MTRFFLLFALLLAARFAPTPTTNQAAPFQSKADRTALESRAETGSCLVPIEKSPERP